MDCRLEPGERQARLIRIDFAGMEVQHSRTAGGIFALHMTRYEVGREKPEIDRQSGKTEVHFCDRKLDDLRLPTVARRGMNAIRKLRDPVEECPAHEDA